MAVEVIGRLYFLVGSHSRKRVEHTVDLEPDAEFPDLPVRCSCESFRYGGRRPCKHIYEACDFIIFQMELPPAQEKEARKKLRDAVNQLFL